MSATYFLHDGIMLHSYGEWRKHVESCPKCRPMIEAQRARVNRLFKEKPFDSLIARLISKDVET